MYGIPTYLATRADYERVHAMALAGECDRALAIAHWQGLLNGRRAYVFDRLLATGEVPDGPEPEYRVLDREREDGTVERVQCRLTEQPDARLYRLGYSVADIEARITDLEAVA